MHPKNNRDFNHLISRYSPLCEILLSLLFSSSALASSHRLPHRVVSPPRRRLALTRSPTGARELSRSTPLGDYVVIKFARLAFEKSGAETGWGTQMRPVGEVMSIGRTQGGLPEGDPFAENGRWASASQDFNKKSLADLMGMLWHARRAQFHHLRGAAQRAGMDEL